MFDGGEEGRNHRASPETGNAGLNETEKLIAEQTPRLRRYARALLGDSVPADDLVQEALLRGLSRQHMWQPGTDMRAWMFTILHNIHVNNQRRAYSRNRLHEPLDDHLEVASPSGQEKGLEIRDLGRALQRLPEAQREVILLVGLEGMDYKSVAAVLEIPLGTVMSRLHRGRDALRRLMGADGDQKSSRRPSNLRIVP